MSIKAKAILQDKFWIVEEQGEKVGTLTKNEDGYIFSKKGNISFYQSDKEISNEFGANFLTAKITTPKDNKELSVHGYPTRSVPYNSMYDIQRKLPLFTKSEKSKSVYCAGFYLIRFNVNWLKSFCPKLVTVEDNDYMGPYKTEIEMKIALSNVKRSN
jgi:hypothetical protein